MKLKKIIAVILAAAMMCGMLCFGTGAETSNQEIFDALYSAMNNYIFYAEFCNGYFPEDGAPSIDTVDQWFKWDVELYFEEYKVADDGYGFCDYEIPAEMYEELVFTAFAKTDALIEKLHSSDIYKTDKDEPYYLIKTGGGFGGYLPDVILQGYTENEDGTYTAYARYASIFSYDENWNEIEYVPSDDDVEGVDYIYICTNVYEYNEETGTESIGAKYVPAELSESVRSVIELPEEDMFAPVYHSYEKIDASEIPAAEDMNVPDESKDVAYVGGAFMEMDRDTFGDGVTVYGEEYWDDEEAEDDVFDTTAELLKEYGELGGVYEFTAMKDGKAVQPNGKVSVSFMLPYDFSPDSTVYYIAEDGTVTELATSIDPDSYEPTLLYATAELEHFSRYAVAGVRYGDSNEDGKVNLGDVTTMLKDIANWDVEMNKIATDANRDGKVNLADVTLILKYIANWEVWFGPAGE